MPAKSAQEPEPEPTPATTTRESATPEPDKPAADKATPGEVPAGRQPAGVYEFTGTIATQYLEVPLTAYPADPGRPATNDDPAIPARPATVFDWPFSAPDDGRWQPTKKKPNQVADNAAPLSTEE